MDGTLTKNKSVGQSARPPSVPFLFRTITIKEEWDFDLLVDCVANRLVDSVAHLREETLFFETKSPE